MNLLSSFLGCNELERYGIGVDGYVQFFGDGDIVSRIRSGTNLNAQICFDGKDTVEASHSNAMYPW